jgi:hypothetical protein
MTKTELDSKSLADLHQLAADQGVERYRMLTRAELIERLSDGDSDDSPSGGGPRGGDSAGEGERGERPKRRRRRSAGGREREERIDVEDEEEERPRGGRSRGAPSRGDREESGRGASKETEKDSEKRPEKDSEKQSEKDSSDEEEGSRPRKRRRRRRFGRRRDGVTIQDLLLPAESGRQAVLLADSREAATELLRGVAAELAGASEGPDPVALLIDPSPEELADWKREAPQAELVSAAQARHTADALASAQRRAAEGEDVILLVDSLTRFADSFGDSDGAKELFDAGRQGAASGKGSLTVVVALERS